MSFSYAEENNITNMLAALRTITERTVSTAVYSHLHTDHNAGAVRLHQLLARQEIELRVVASASAAREIAIQKNNVYNKDEGMRLNNLRHKK